MVRPLRRGNRLPGSGEISIPGGDGSGSQTPCCRDSASEFLDEPGLSYHRDSLIWLTASKPTLIEHLLWRRHGGPLPAAGRWHGAGVRGVTQGRGHTLPEFWHRRPCRGLGSRKQGGVMAAARVRPAEGVEGTEGKARRQGWRGVRRVEEAA